MAFTTIDFDGTGIVAYADGETTDTGGGSWGELGAGTVSDNPDVYLYGSNSFASKYASKVGRTYYQDNGTLNHSTNGELVYMFINIQSNGQFSSYGTGTFNGSFNAMIGSSTGDLRHWNIANKGDSNGWAGGWKCIVIDPTLTTGTESEGTPSLTATNTYGVWIDTDVSVRADSIFQSMIISAKGIYFTGTPTSNGWKELADWATDYANRAAGVLETRGSTIFMKGAVTVGDGSTSTTFTSNGNNVECEESSFYNGSTWVTSYATDANQIVTTANSSIDWTNVSVSGFVDNKLILNTSAGNASSFSGGALKLLQSLTVKSSDTFDGVVFSTNDALTLGTASYDNCTFTSSDTVSVDSTVTSFTNNTIRNSTGTQAVTTDTLSNLDGCTFDSAGTGYAVNLGNITSNTTMDWNCTATGYAGTDGTTGNEIIRVDVAAGVTLTISSSGTAPTFHKTGSGTINVVSNTVTVRVTVQDTAGAKIANARVYLVADTAGVVLSGLTNGSGVIEDTAFSYAGDDPVSGWARKSSAAPYYKEGAIAGTITSAGFNGTAILILDQ